MLAQTALDYDADDKFLIAADPVVSLMRSLTCSNPWVGALSGWVGLGESGGGGVVVADAEFEVTRDILSLSSCGPQNCRDNAAKARSRDNWCPRHVLQ